jgi:hypothetical protein
MQNYILGVITGFLLCAVAIYFGAKTKKEDEKCKK